MEHQHHTATAEKAASNNYSEMFHSNIHHGAKPSMDMAKSASK